MIHFPKNRRVAIDSSSNKKAFQNALVPGVYRITLAVRNSRIAIDGQLNFLSRVAGIIFCVAVATSSGCASGGAGGPGEGDGGSEEDASILSDGAIDSSSIDSTTIDAEIPPNCGDGVVDPGEECDDGDQNSDTIPDACRTNCIASWCGDGVIDSDEQCDSGDVGSATCEQLGYDGGEITCNGDICMRDESGCFVCGDSECSPAEDSCSCPEDCGSQCGDGCCNGTETTCSCPEDCGDDCGDGCCTGSEDSCSCPEDCGNTCGDGCCNGSETTCTCPDDCGSQCGDDCCNGTEDTCNCHEDCGSQCGDGCCNGTESTCSCPDDCGSFCGDGCCNGAENTSNCPSDCGSSCIGVSVGGTCFYLADLTDRSKIDAESICSGLGSNWSLCSSTEICQTEVYTYLSDSGCSCDGGSNLCNCALSNVYIHASDFTNSLWIRTDLISGCSTGDMCQESTSSTCGSVLCCQ